jgi:glycosyltransferase involved in cell wall biosynthesis
MKISIAMATYNGAKYLQEQLDSFMGQTRFPDELVVCDDGSNDETIGILERFEKQAPFQVRIYRNADNIGFTQNFGKAIGLCQGDIIFLSDQDDVWLPKKIATLEKSICNSSSSLLVINDLEITDSELNPTGLTVLGQNSSLGFGEDHFNPGCCMAFSSTLKPLILPIPSQAITHDSWINTIVLEIGARCLLRKPLQFYRRHGSNSSNWIGSRISRVHWIDQFESEPVQTLSSDYSRRRDILGIIVQRLIELGVEAYSGLGAVLPFSEAITRLETERQALSLRGTLIEAGGAKRKFIAISMWLNGDYRFFRGWKSFAKDMLR